MQTVLRERRVDELQRLVRHQLELTNSIEHYRSVKTINAEICVTASLVVIHYCFARGLQEKADERRFVLVRCFRRPMRSVPPATADCNDLITRASNLDRELSGLKAFLNVSEKLFRV